MTDTHYLLRIANRLAESPAGSLAADIAIHFALGRTGRAPLYTSQAKAACSLLPPGFEWLLPMHSQNSVYMACRRGELDFQGHHRPHVGQWGATQALAMCGAAIRAHAKLVSR